MKWKSLTRPGAVPVTLLLALVLPLLIQAGPARASFSDSGTVLSGVENSALAWVDFDNDGDLDLALAGKDGTNVPIMKIYLNNGGVIADSGLLLDGFEDCSMVWADFDNDGILDLAMAGQTSSGGATIFYSNCDGQGSFCDLGSSIVGTIIRIEGSSLAYGDFDNDGQRDVALTGFAPGYGIVTKIFRNDDWFFTDTGEALEGVYDSALAWGDYDNDSDLDLALSGNNGSGGVTRIYRNDGGHFSDSAAALQGVYDGSLAWGDYDNDGDLDLALAGNTGAVRVARIYRNDSGVFNDSGAVLEGVSDGSLAWGDYDNDGDLDLALAGYNGSASVTRIYRNDNGVFADSGVALQGVSNCSLAWGDYDQDGYLDLALAGTGGGPVSRVYRNDGNWGTGPNTAPAPPSSAWVEGYPADLVLRWTAGSDAQTPAAGLSYNLMIWNCPYVFLHPMADPDTGWRRVATLGPSQQAAGFRATGLKNGDRYFWGVQTVDSALAGSTFVSGGSFVYYDENFPPNIYNFSKLGDTNMDIAFSPNDFSDHVYDQHGDEFTAVRIASLPARGVLRLSGVPLTTGAEIGYTQLGGLTYTPNTDWHGTDFFTWQAHDSVQWTTTAAYVYLLIGAPEVITTSVVKYDDDHSMMPGDNFFKASGEVLGRGRSTLQKWGFTWGTSNPPTTADHISYDTPNIIAGYTGLGPFYRLIQITRPGIYYFRAFATSGAGTAYGDVISVTIPAKSVVQGTVPMSILLGLGGFSGMGPAATGTEGAALDGSAATGSDNGGWSDNPDEEKKKGKAAGY